MRKIKYLLFLFIILIGKNVFAQNVTSSVLCNVNSSSGTYYGDPNDGFNSARCYDMGTRYSPRLGYIEFYLPTSVMSFTAGKSYTVTMNMSTNDWRNNIMIQNVRYINTNGSVVTSTFPSMTNYRFISKRQIKFDFTLPTGTMYPYLRFVLSSTTYANPDPDISSSKYMTGDTNWNLSSIDISPVSSSSGGSSSGGSTSGSYDDSGIINNNNQNTTDIINNNNQNTTDVITNQNELLSSECSNILDITSASVIGNGASNVSYTTSSLQFTGTSTNVNGSNFIIYTLNVTPHTNYYFSLSNGYKVTIFDINYNELHSSTLNYFTFNSSGYYTLLLAFFAPYNDTGVYNNVMVSSTNGSFCVYGSSTSKIDAASSAISGAITGAVQGGISDVITNQNTNSENEINSQRVCKKVVYSVGTDKVALNPSTGNFTNNNYYFVTDYIPLTSSDKLNKLEQYTGSAGNCFYNNNKSLISCFSNTDYPTGNIPIPTNTQYVRFTINRNDNRPQYEICKNGNQALTDSLTDSNVDNDVGSDFFDDFESQDFGLSQIITIPLNTIQSLTSKSCVPLQIPIPFTNSNVTLPCMTEIYETKFPTIYNLWKIVSFGIVAYLIAIDIFHIVKGFKDPESDKVEVLDL